MDVGPELAHITGEQREQIEAFCKRWGIVEFALFGSILRDDFGPDSDVDCCVVYENDTVLDIDDIFAMQDELSEIFGGRDVDLVERRQIRNPFRRHSIITTRRVVYAA